MLKTEATNCRLFKSLLHIQGQEKSVHVQVTADYSYLEVTMHTTRGHVTSLYSCDWLLCFKFLLLQVTVGTGYHVCQKQKPHIEGVFSK